MQKIRLGILGGGGDSLIGVLHRVASFINDNLGAEHWFCKANRTAYQ